MSNTIYSTDDMSLVTYLRLNYYQPEQVLWDNNTCWWSFDNDPGLSDLVLKFINNEASCNPKEFSRQFKLTRQEFHQARPTDQRRVR